MQSKAQQEVLRKGRMAAWETVADQRELRDHLLLEAVKFGASKKNISRLFGLGSSQALNNAIWRAKKRRAENENASGDQT